MVGRSDGERDGDVGWEGLDTGALVGSGVDGGPTPSPFVGPVGLDTGDLVGESEASGRLGPVGFCTGGSVGGTTGDRVGDWVGSSVSSGGELGVGFGVGLDVIGL